MLTHRAHTTGVRRRLAQPLRLAAWLLVVFYFVASGRAFLPGVCATQRALDAQNARDSGAPSMYAPRACCYLPLPEGSESEAPLAPENSGCALCKLVSSAAPLVVAVHAPAPQAHAFSALPPQNDQCAALFLDRTLQSRAPPRFMRLS
ncbi:MAG: hypothetical protein KF886_03560 [Candidatus Hydrogenedentes bacterium]|nr:hypothetical protein [Candidatus Hydrogenedentota bacterium]